MSYDTNYVDHPRQKCYDLGQVMTEAGPVIVQAIRRLAQDPDSVRVRAGADFRRFRVTRYDVCDALIAWIDAQKPMEEIVTTEVKEFLGDPAYVARPLFEGVEFYVKVTVYGDPDTNEEMLIISTHPA